MHSGTTLQYLTPHWGIVLVVDGGPIVEDEEEPVIVVVVEVVEETVGAMKFIK